MGSLDLPEPIRIVIRETSAPKQVKTIQVMTHK